MTAANAARALAPAPDPEIVRGIRKASQASGVDFGFLMAQAAQESGFRADVRASGSSASGLFQFVDRTWLDLVRRHGARHGIGEMPKAQLLELRHDPKLSAAMAAEYARENRAALESALGRKAGAADLYFAHFLGAGGATKFLEALERGGSVKAAELMPGAAASNRAVFYDRDGAAKTVGTIYRELSQKIERQAGAWTDTAPAATGMPEVRSVAGGSPAQLGFRPPRLSRPMVEMVDALAFSALKLLEEPREEHRTSQGT